MPVFNLGALNTTALTAPDVYVQKIPPRTRYINGVPTDILGLVGVGSWGPVNSAILATDATFGPVTNRKYDLASAIQISSQVGSNNVRAVRVTDGTDVAAVVNVIDTVGSPLVGVVLTAYYTGTIGNTLSYTISAGTKASTFKLSINRAGYASEVFDNISGSGSALWAAMVSAVNIGQFGITGPSKLALASIPVSNPSSGTPKVQSAAFSGGTDGVSSVTDATLIGSDGVTASARSGMYSLRSSGAQVLNLVDLVDNTQWANILALANSEGMYACVTGSAGQSYSTVSTNLVSAGTDDPGLKPCVGDWWYWQDTTNGVLRLMSPATLAAAKLAALSPEQSTLNKALPAITGTQRTAQNQPYGSAEIGAIATSRLDVITNPCPGGQYYGFRTGRNASSDPTRNGDNYTRMTNYLALTLAASFGFVVGETQTPDLRAQAKASMDAFLWNLQQQNMIGDVNGGPAFSVEIDAANNPSSRVALGYLQADVQVKYLSIVWFFLVNLEGGQSVTVRQVGTNAA